MSKNVFKKPHQSNSTLIPSSINQNSSNFITNSNLIQGNQSFSSFSNLENIEEDPYFFSPSSVNIRPGRIIHQSTEQSIDQKGNRVIKTKTIREIDSNTINKNNKNRTIKIITKNKSQKYYKNLNLNNSNNNIKNINNLYDLKTYNRINQKEIYSSPNIIQVSPNYNEITSPLMNINNYSIGSENEESHMKSFEVKNKYFLNRLRKIKKTNYELEDPEIFDYLKQNRIKRINKGRNLSRKNKNIKKNQEIKTSKITLNKSEYYDHSKIINKSNQSDFLDFQSPDKDFTNQNKFRKITENMIDSKGPTNDDKKVTKSIKNKMIIELDNKKHVKYYKNKNEYNLSQIEAAKIIQNWWRRNFTYREKEVYDITVKSAIKLQSFFRGYLIRKNVLRYITLAIY